MTTANPWTVGPFVHHAEPLRTELWSRVRGPGSDTVPADAGDGGPDDPTEERILRATELETLGRLAGGIAHDFNNLLTSILGNTHLALADLGEGAPREAILEVETAARRGRELVAQILAWSGRGRLELVPTDVGDVVRETRQLLLRVLAPDAQVVLDIEPLAVVEADPTQLRQVVMNLLTNASDALEGRPGTITVRVRARVPDGRGTSYVLLEVSDDGCGMSATTLERMFEPFYTTKPNGRGLGLAALRGIVRHHRGEVRVESRPGRGTTFRVWLPRSDSDSLVTPGFSLDREAAPEPETRAGTVLVVEDEELVRKVATRMVGRLGYEVLTAASGPEALELLDQAPELACALVDVQMPGMTGREVLRAIRAARPGVPVILMTGYAGNDADRAAPTPDRWLRKPFSTTELQEALASTALSRTSPARSR